MVAGPADRGDRLRSGAVPQVPHTARHAAQFPQNRADMLCEKRGGHALETKSVSLIAALFRS